MKTGEQNVLRHLDNLLKSGIGSDIDFLVKGHKFPVHTIILQGGSTVMAAMFEHHDMSERVSRRSMVIEDVEPEVFQQLLHYLYNGNAPRIDEGDITEPLFIAADKYQVDSLKNWCSSLMSNKLNAENAVRYLVLAHLHLDDKLQTDCINYILKKTTDFFQRQDFKELSRNHPDLFFQVAQLLCENPKK